MKAPIDGCGAIGVYPLVPMSGERSPSSEGTSGGQKKTVPAPYPLVTRPAETLPSPRVVSQYLAYEKMQSHAVTPRRVFSKGLYIDLWA